MIVDEVERRYDRLLKYFTNNIMYNAAYISSSNPTLSSPQSSTFRNLFGQSNTYRIEELKSFSSMLTMNMLQHHNPNLLLSVEK